MPTSDIIDNIPVGLDASTKFIIVSAIVIIGVLSTVIVTLSYAYFKQRNKELQAQAQNKDEIITLVKDLLSKKVDEVEEERRKNEDLNKLINEKITPALIQSTNAINLFLQNVIGRKDK